MTMCELFAMSSCLPANVRFSLDTFSRRGGLDGPHKDGWGVAYYADNDVRLIKEPRPASDSACVRFIHDHPFASTLVLSHIRHATRGPVAMKNCQPFARELGGHMHLFAHNGRLDNIDSRHARAWRRFQPIGDTDSEIAFCILLERLAHLWTEHADPPLEARLAIVQRFAADMRELGPANFLYCDGDVLFAHSHRRLQADGGIAPPGLWRLQRWCATDTHELLQAGVAIDAGNQQDVVLLASVPLTSEPWTAFTEGEVIAIKNGKIMSASSKEDEQNIEMPICA